MRKNKQGGGTCDRGKNPPPTLERIEQHRVVWRGINKAARHLGVSQAHLSLVLNGHRKPGERLVRGLARLGVTPKQFQKGA